MSLLEFSGEADHVHLLIEYLPALRLSDFIRALKSVSSKKIRAEFHSAIRHLLGVNVFGQDHTALPLLAMVPALRS